MKGSSNYFSKLIAIILDSGENYVKVDPTQKHYQAKFGSYVGMLAVRL